MSGLINGQVTKLANQPEKLAEYMKDKTDEEKRQARNHLKTIKALRNKHGK